MKRVLSILICLNIASAVTAGSVDTPLMDITPITVSTPVGVGPAWGGFYAGATASLESGEQNYFSGDAFSNGPWGLDGSLYGGFAGYNFQSGSLVYGAEAAYSIGSISSDVPSTFGADYSNMIDVKARAGYSIGDALVYGVVGGSFGTWDDRTGPPETASTTGVNYGLGVDYQISDSVFLGAEYLVRNLSGEFAPPSDVSIDTLTRSAQIRVGLQF